MVRFFKITYILLINALILFSCNQTKYVPAGKYLLKKNSIQVVDGKLETDQVNALIRQKANTKNLQVKFRLWAYNQIDSSVVAAKRTQANIALRRKNESRIARQTRINDRRIVRARKKNREYYTEKLIPLKDTISPRLLLKEWFKYKLGEQPVVLDSIPFTKTVEQLTIYLKSKGYYYGNVSGTIAYNTEKRKASVSYRLHPGAQYTIDSVYVETDNATVLKEYNRFVELQGENPFLNTPFDSDFLNDYREKIAKHMRNNSLYGFSSSHVNYLADTNKRNMGVTLGVRFTDRLIRSVADRDSLIGIKHKTTYIKEVYFHIADTTYFKGNFKQTVEQMGLTLQEQQFVRALDTLVYAEVKRKNSTELDPHRYATFIYNGELSIDPAVLEIQNYLENENVYRESYLERSFSRLLQLGLFEVIKPVILEIPSSDSIEVHYYLVPAKKKTFGFEPRATNSNGFLGVSASINFINKNLTKGAERLTVSLSGGFESQPPIFTSNLDGSANANAGRSFNTFEIGPSVKLELPRFFPARVTFFAKKRRPSTVLSTAYNYQLRLDFERQIFQMNYLWKFYVAKTQVYYVGLPFVSVIKIVRIQNKPDFQAKLDLLNDLFLKNAYSNQFVWQDWKMTFEYNNKDKETRRNNVSIYMNSSFDPAGNLLSLFRSFQDTIANGQRTIFGVGYSQFARIDNEIVAAKPLGRKQSLHGRIQLGGGFSYGNTQTSMPYDYSFFAGGANDNRGWRARALGPGSYKYYLDTNRTATQIGDIRIAGSVEYRFTINKLLKGAFFMDAGNLWTWREDINRVGSKISPDWFREIALSTGVGLRLDLDFFVIRVDLGLPITNPALPLGARWIFQSRTPYYEEGIATFGETYKQYMPIPFRPVLHAGIGFPF